MVEGENGCTRIPTFPTPTTGAPGEMEFKTVKISLSAKIEYGSSVRTVGEYAEVPGEEVNLTSVDGVKHTANLLEKVLYAARNSLIFSIISIIIALIVEDRESTGATRGKKRSITVESVLGRFNIPAWGISLKDFPLRKKVYTLLMEKVIANGITVMSLRNLNDDINFQQGRSEKDALHYRTLSDHIIEIGVGAYNAVKSAAMDVLKQYATWSKGVAASVKDLSLPTIEEEVARAQGWCYEQTADPTVLAEHEGNVKAIARKINNENHDAYIKRAKKKYGTNFSRKKADHAFLRRVIRITNIARAIERPDEPCIYVMIDGVLSHHQTEKHDGLHAKDGKWIDNYVVYIEADGRRKTFTAPEIDALLNIVLGYLISSNLLSGRRLIFFADGETAIWDAVSYTFRFIQFDYWLDWYHLADKCYKLLSSALCGSKKQKAAILHALKSILWNGNVDAAIDFLNSLSKKVVCDPFALANLTGYLQRKKTFIPCYAIRHELGLLNSSNLVEQSNNLLVALRQKNNGMSWSREGSLAVATLTALRRNGDLDFYLKTGTVSLSSPGTLVGGKRAARIRAQAEARGGTAQAA